MSAWTRRLLTAGAFVLAAALIAAAWLRLLTDRPPAEDVLIVVGTAALPALAVGLVRGWLAAVVWPASLAVALMLAAGQAFGVPVTEARPRDPARDFFGPVVERFELGLRDFYTAVQPFDRISHPEMTGLVLSGLFVFVVIAGMLLGARQLTAASAVVLIAVGWPATMIANVDPDALAVGTVLLAALLVFLYLARSGRRPLGGVVQAVVLGAAVVLVGVGISTSSAVAKPAVLDWRSWSPFDRGQHTVGLRYVWNTSYAGIHWPENETVVLEVRGPTRSVYWRATSLDEYTGIGWVESLERGDVTTEAQLDLDRDPLLPRAARNADTWLQQDVTVAHLADEHLIAAGQPVRWQLGGGRAVQPAQSGVVFVADGLQPGQAYTVWSYTPEVSPDDLIDVEPASRRMVARYLEVLPGAAVPRFGVPTREQRLQRLLARQEGTPSEVIWAPHERLYEQALRVVGSAPTPYLAVVALEQWFRSTGGFTYNELPPRPSGKEPPLVEFVLETREGYCQHYAGAMALMLRMLGVPSRVAAGFVSGELDERTGVWTVVDRDAHTWVEVWFPRFGWLPFDPTPGRGSLGGGYSVSSETFDLSAEGDGRETAAAVADNPDLAEIFQEELLGLGLLGADGAGLFSGVELGGGGPPAVEASSGGVPAWAMAILAVFAMLVALVLAKLVSCRARLRAHSPQRVARALRRDVVGFLADQGLQLPASLTLEEFGAQIEAAYRVDTTAFVRAACAARFAKPQEAEPAADAAKVEHRTLIRALRGELGGLRRARGLCSVRSLFPRARPGLPMRLRQGEPTTLQRA